MVDRGRAMYSASLSKKNVIDVWEKLEGKNEEIYKTLGKISKGFLTIEERIGETNKNGFYEAEAPDIIFRYLRKFIAESEDVLRDFKDEEFIDEFLGLFFNINRFILIGELYGDDYVTYYENLGDDIRVTLFCVNPSEKIKFILDKIQGSVIFSATLSPMEYYIDLLGGSLESYRLRLDSPFEEKNLQVIKKRIGIRYKERLKTLDLVCKEIEEFIKEVEGNYLVFFPSYEYLDMAFEKIKNIEGRHIMVQRREMSPREREEYLEIFENERNIVGFGVLGGMFSEGVDLPGDKLIGAVIVGVGYPKISMEREIIKEYFKGKGFDYAYIYPGINKVMQGAGRVIRKEEDKGRVLLIDDRYYEPKYKRLLPSNWN